MWLDLKIPLCMNNTNRCIHALGDFTTIMRDLTKASVTFGLRLKAREQNSAAESSC